MCGAAWSGVQVLKGDLRGRLLLANLDHLSVQWRKRRDHTIRPGSRHGTTVCVHTPMDMEQQSDLHLGWSNKFMEQGRIPLASMVCKRGGANGSEPKPVHRKRITQPLALR